MAQDKIFDCSKRNCWKSDRVLNHKEWKKAVNDPSSLVNLDEFDPNRVTEEGLVLDCDRSSWKQEPGQVLKGAKWR